MMLPNFQEYVRRVEEMLADPERVDPARLAKADQILPDMRKQWDELIEVSRPLLHKGMGAVDFVDFTMTAMSATGLPPEQLAALIGIALLRSHETARRRFCGIQAEGCQCVLPPHQGDRHVHVGDDGIPHRFGWSWSGSWCP